MISAIDTELVFNELSIIPPAENKYIAREWMSGLAQVIKAASKAGVKRVIRTDEDFSSLNISHNYSIYNWFTDNEADKEERRYISSLSGKFPLIGPLDNNSLEDSFYLKEFRFKQQSAKGLGFALLTDNLALSIDSHEEWNSHQLEIEFDEMDENGEVSTHTDIANHACKTGHISGHIPWIQRKIGAGINNGVELWNRKEKIFPSLLF